MPQAHRQTDPLRSPSARLAVALAFAALITALPGCQSSPLSIWRQAFDDSLSKAPTKDETGDDRSLLNRWLAPKSAPSYDPTKTTPLVKGPRGWSMPKVAPNPEADAELEAAKKLFQQGKLAEAEKEFGKMAKKYKGKPWGESAQFYVAECLFQRGKYVWAHDAYEKLFADYPNSNYLEKLVRREYEIAQIWLALDDPGAKDRQPIPWYGRFDGSRPLIDTGGYAQQALDHVRQHMIEGPLADKAAMQVADRLYRLRDYEGAAAAYNEVITLHPKSQFLQRAYLSSIDSEMKGYVGPEYDGAGLDRARELIKRTMNIFPDRPEANEKLYHTLDLINDATAERMYTIGDYYKRTGNIASAEYYFGMLPQKWPQSPWTVKAKTQLAALAKMPRKKSVPYKILTQPGANDPFSSGYNGMNGMGMPGMGGGGMGGGGMGMPGGMF